MDILILDKVEVGRGMRRQQSEQAAYTCYCSHVLVRSKLSLSCGGFRVVVTRRVDGRPDATLDGDGFAG